MFLVVLIAGLLLVLNALEKSVPLTQFYPTAGIASWYTSVLTATGEKLDDNSLTCAMRRRDFGKHYRVCNQENGRCVVVRHNNWGPCWILFAQGRIVDLTRSAFSLLADPDKGLLKASVIPVVITVAPAANSFDSGVFALRYMP